MNFGKVGLITPASDGSRLDLRLGRNRELVITDDHGRFANGTSNGLMFSAMTAITGTTIVAANVSPVGAAAATIFSIYNPLGSGINAEIIKTWMCMISGTSSNGPYVYNVASGQNISAIPNNAGTSGSMPSSNNSPITGKVQAFTQIGLTGGTVTQSLLRPFAYSMNTVISSLVTFINSIDLVDGEIVVPPGGILTVAPATVGTNCVVGVGMEWMEIPL